MNSGCGAASSATGPFYCPLDQKVYIDLGFFDELNRRFKAPGDFAQAYVLAHEIGHHVQQQLGIEGKVREESQQNPGDANALSVRLELQADCFAGVWARSTYDRGILESGDLQEGLTAAAAVGDDRIQQQAAGPDRPRDLHPRHLRAAGALAADRLRLGEAGVLRHLLRRHLAAPADYAGSASVRPAEASHSRRFSAYASGSARLSSWATSSQRRAAR